MAIDYNLGRSVPVDAGTYNPETPYVFFDLLTYNGGSYLVLQNVTGVTPTNDHVNYLQIAAKGDPGGTWTVAEDIPTEDGSTVGAKMTLFNLELADKANQAMLDGILDVSNLFNKNSVTGSHYVNSSDGTLTASSATWCSSDYIAVIPGKTYFSNANSMQFAWYDRSKVFISGGSLGSNGSVPTVPSNAAYIRFSMQAANAGTIMFVNNSSLPTSYLKYGLRIKRSAVINYSDIVMSTLGDSQTSQARWQPTVVSRLGLASYINNDTNGALLAHKTGSDCFTDMVASVGASDIVTVWGGTNDFTANVPLGTIASTNVDEFYGALKYLVQYLSTNMPNAVVLFMTPLPRFTDFTQPPFDTYMVLTDGVWRNSVGASLEDYATAMLDVCKKYNVRCINLYHDSGINQWNETTYLTDKLHMTLGGGVYVGNIIANKIGMLI
jgi:hypothetical protein